MLNQKSLKKQNAFEINTSIYFGSAYGHLTNDRSQRYFIVMSSLLRKSCFIN